MTDRAVQGVSRIAPRRTAYLLLYGTVVVLFATGCADRRIEQLTRKLKDRDASVRCSTVVALVGTGSSRAVPLLIGTLQDKDTAVRRMSIQALGNVRDERTQEPLLRCLCDQDCDVRRVAAEVLTQMRWTPTNDAEMANLLVAMDSSHEGIVLGVAAVEPLAVFLRESDGTGRLAAARLLSHIKHPDAAQALLAALKADTSSFNRYRIGTALNRLIESDPELVSIEALLAHQLAHHDDFNYYHTDKLLQLFPIKASAGYVIKKGFVLADAPTAVVLPSKNTAARLDELTTLVLVHYDYLAVGSYKSRDGSADYDTISAIQYTADVTIVDWNQRAGVIKRSFAGGMPPDEVEVSAEAVFHIAWPGTRPDEAITNWLRRLCK